MVIVANGGADSRDFLTKVQVFSFFLNRGGRERKGPPRNRSRLSPTFARFPRFPAEVVERFLLLAALQLFSRSTECFKIFRTREFHSFILRRESKEKKFRRGSFLFSIVSCFGDRRMGASNFCEDVWSAIASGMLSYASRRKKPSYGPCGWYSQRTSLCFARGALHPVDLGSPGSAFAARFGGTIESLGSPSQYTEERWPAALNQGPGQLRRDINIRSPLWGAPALSAVERTELEHAREKGGREGAGERIYARNHTVAMGDPEAANLSIQPPREETRDASFRLFLKSTANFMLVPTRHIIRHSRRWCNQLGGGGGKRTLSDENFSQQNFLLGVCIIEHF